MFIGRERELASLNERFRSQKFEFAVVYGRRRVGKTTLLNEFLNGKKNISYTATETNAKQNLYDLSRCIFSAMGQADGASFETYQAAFEAVFKFAQTQRMVFVIDEYPYLAESAPEVASILQKLIDQNKDTSQLFLILCGSSMSFMENQVLGYKSPLYGRRTCQYKIQPFDFFETKEYFSKFSPIDVAVIYGITGGTPLYVSMMDEEASLAENIKNNFLTANAYLYEEPTNLIKQECRDAGGYNAVILALANGATRISDIASKTGIGQTLVVDYLKKLIGLGLVKRETPFGTLNSKKSIYTICDSMFRFWYRFVPENIPNISRGLVDNAYRRVETHISEFMGPVFEEICKQYLWRKLEQKACPVNFLNIDRWWGTDPLRKCPSEIDIIGDDGESTGLFAECKWTNSPIDLCILELLMQRSAIFSYEFRHFFLFGKSGFTEGCIKKAGQLGNVHLVRYLDIFQET